MGELGAQAISSQEKKLQPLFTSGSGQKRTQGKSFVEYRRYEIFS